MTALDESKSYIEKLPIELLCIILDLCRPDVFESAVLSCKTFHHAALDLIEKHNVCRHFQTVISQKQDDLVLGYVIIQDGFQFMEDLLNLPANLVRDQLRYFTHINLRIPPRSRPRDLSPSTQEMLKGYPELALALFENDRDYWLRARIDDGDEVNSNQMIDWSPPLTPPRWPVQYQPDFLSLFTNLQSLIIHGEHFTHVSSFTKDIAPLMESGTLFQRLEDVMYTNVRGNTYETISPFLNLPRLKTLVVDSFDLPSDLSSEYNICNEGTNLIHTIALCRAHLRPRHVGKLLERCPLLHTFLWESYRTPPAFDSLASSIQLDTFEYFENFDPAPYDDGVQEILDTSAKEMIPLSDELDFDCETEIFPHWMTTEEERYPPYSFKPLILLKLLENTHQDTLQHLGISIDKFREPYSWIHILRKFKIVHFLTFQNLTHLEFDIRILRPRKGTDFDYPSLAGILPKSLQRLRLFISAGPGNSYDEMEQLFDSLPDARMNLPYLEDIFVWYRHHGFSSYNPVLDELTGEYVENLRPRLQEVDIAFTLEVVAWYHNCTPKADWSGGPNIIDNVLAIERSK